jgi:hypothetical protein
MTFEELLEAAERRRLEGNDLFKAGDHEGALGRYLMAMSFINDDLLVQVRVGAGVCVCVCVLHVIGGGDRVLALSHY